MGRTGRWLASEHFGMTPDIVVLGKGLGGGVAPLSAVVAREELVAALAGGSGAFNHAQTYSHHPVSCAAGLATLRYLRRHRLVERCAALERPFFEALAAVGGDPRVGDIRGKGLLAGIELVMDRESKEPFPRSARFAERLTAAAMAHGLVVWPNTGHVDGERGDLVMVAPPFTIGEDEIHEIAARLGAALGDIE
jgi:adenosylmethionine-8-amino-7-oxononanoate aminotransferase